LAKYVRNPGGGIHSVPDDFTAPDEWGQEGKDWEVVDEAAARDAAAPLFGAPDPAVLRHRLSDERAADPDDDGVPGDPEPAAAADEEVAA
jgi:hypothetical protein